ncbi:MAG: porin family protein [Mucinivorans sp.]
MKKILLSLCLLFLLVGNASAHKLFSFGLKAGLNLATVSGLSDVIHGAKPDFTGGVFFEVRPIKWVGVSIEALYSGQGFKTGQISVEDWTASIDASLGYIAVPIMARIYVAGGLSLNVGYQPSFLVSTSLGVGRESGANLQMTKVVSAIPVGISYSFRWGLMLDLRYNIGLTSANKPIDFSSVPNAVTRESLSVKNQVYTLTVGWRF